MGTRADAATEKRIVCKLYQKLKERGGSWNAEDAAAPMRRIDTWPTDTKNCPIRNIASHLFGISSSKVGEYRGKMKGNDGILAAENPRGPPGGRGGIEDLAIKGAAPDDRSLYDIIKGRISHAHSTGHVNTPRNPLKWGTSDPGGPKSPNVSARISEIYSKDLDLLTPGVER